MGDSIYVIKPDTFFGNIAQDSIARNNINKELETNTPLELKEPSELYNAIKDWNTGNSLAKAEWKQWALSDFEGFKEYYKQYRTLLKNLDIDKLYGAKAKPNRVASYGSKTDIGKELFQSLLNAGFSEVLALAILANSYYETMGWNKMNLLNNGPATGLLQMEEAARLSYDNFREANNLEENTDALALYIASLFLNGKSIPTTYYDNSGKGEAYTTALALEDWNSGDLDKTVKAFMYSYERPGTPMLDKRLNVALLLSDNKHLFYKEGGSIKRNNTKSTFFAKNGLPDGVLRINQQPSSIMSNIRSEIAKRAYNNIIPRGYNNALSRIWRGIILNEDTSNSKLASTRRDALAALYFQIPEDLRHSTEGRKNNGGVHLSKYKPTRGNQNEDYYALDLTNKEKRGLIRRGLEVPIGKTYQVREKQEGSVSGISGLLDFGISRGYDNKGEYVSYTDFWDLSPISLNPIKYLIPGSSNHNGLLRDPIGKPFNVYDRIYLDDYYLVPEEKRGTTYLQEITVTPNKVSSGFYSTANKHFKK